MSPQTTVTRPNVVLVVLDTVRRDRVSAYGYDRETMPTFDSFVRDATRFEDPVTQGTWSIPSHASLFTGLYPRAHGATTIRPVLQASRPLAVELSEAGYETYAVSPNEYVRPATGFGRGFDEFDTDSVVTAPEPVVSWFGPVINRVTSSVTLRRPVERAFNWIHQQSGVATSDLGVARPPEYGITDRVEALLSRASDPFFLFVNLPHAHLPRSPDPEQYERFVDDDASASEVVTDERAHFYGDQRMDEDAVTAMSQLYDADLRTLDDRLQELLDVLSSAGVLSESLVILVADHGEHLGECGLVGHQHSVFEPVVSVPLAIRSPEGGPETVEGQVETRRIYHTILDETGVRPFPELSLMSGVPDRIARGSFVSPMVDLARFLREDQVVYDPALLGEALSFERTGNRKVVEFGSERWEFSVPEH